MKKFENEFAPEYFFFLAKLNSKFAYERNDVRRVCVRNTEIISISLVAIEIEGGEREREKCNGEIVRLSAKRRIYRQLANTVGHDCDRALARMLVDSLDLKQTQTSTL